MDKLLKRLRIDYPHLRFELGETFCWSPLTNQIFYPSGRMELPAAAYSMLHEVAHALLQHHHYTNDFELLQLEIAAWERAEIIAAAYDIMIDNDHVQNCIDSYRDWLYGRSICPGCGTKCLQCDYADRYQCFNCQSQWRVSSSKFCRPYRVRSDDKKLPTTAGIVGNW